MKTIKFIIVCLFALSITMQVKASDEIQKEIKTAESVFEFASKMETFDAEILKAEMKGLSRSERAKLIDMAKKDAEEAQKAGLSSAPIGLYILAVILPPLAVGIHTGWDTPTLLNVLWTLLGWFPGIIHAFIVLGR